MIAINAAPAPELPAPADHAAAAPVTAQANERDPATFALLLGLALDAPGGDGKRPARDAASEAENAAADAVPSPGPAEALAGLPAAIVLQPPAASPAAAPNATLRGGAGAALALAHARGPEALASAPGMVAKTAPVEPGAIADVPAGHAARAGNDVQAANESLPQPALPAPLPELHKGTDAVSTVPLAHAAPVQAQAEVAPAPLRVTPQVHAPEFPREFATQVHIAVQRGVEQASIQVNPPELGPVQVRLEIGNGEARVHFAAENAATRDAITDALPKLRELLGSQGLSLAGSSVGAEMPGREHEATQRQGHAARGVDRASVAAAAEAAHATHSTLRLVDVFV